MNIENRSGYAKKQALGRGLKPGALDPSSFSEETRPCIRVYNEELLPFKRNSPAYSEENPSKHSTDDFSKHFTRLEEIFNSISTLPEEKSEEVQSILEIPSQSPMDLLKNFACELDKACRLTPSQVKVLEKFGVEWNVDPWKYQPRTKSFSVFRGRKDFKFRRPRNATRNVRRFDEVNVEDLVAGLPKMKKAWSLFKGFILKKLAPGVSVKKDLIAQSKLSQSSN
jgi:hypothetical protein